MPVWTGAENLAPTWIRSPDLPARSQSLYRLGYLGPAYNYTDGGGKGADKLTTFMYRLS
jgi:hypothetical protein